MEKHHSEKEEQLAEVVEDLDKNIEVLDENIGKLNRSLSFWNTFGRGVVGAIGAAIGGALVIGLVIYILQSLAGVPFVGDYFNLLLNQIQPRP
jgi:hypothetical protein